MGELPLDRPGKHATAKAAGCHVFLAPKPCVPPVGTVLVPEPIAGQARGCLAAGRLPLA